MTQVTNSIRIHNANIFHGRFRNFAGRPTAFDRIEEGKDVYTRTFCVELKENDPDYEYGDRPLVIDDLIADGWNIKTLAPKEEGDEPVFYIQVKVQFGRIPPKIRQRSSNGDVDLDETTVDSLDWADITDAKMIIRPYNYAPGKVSAYLKTLFVTISDRSYKDDDFNSFD
jgi:hypothetical protein